MDPWLLIGGLALGVFGLWEGYLIGSRAGRRRWRETAKCMAVADRESKGLAGMIPPLAEVFSAAGLALPEGQHEALCKASAALSMTDPERGPDGARLYVARAAAVLRVIDDIWGHGFIARTVGMHPVGPKPLFFDRPSVDAEGGEVPPRPATPT